MAKVVQSEFPGGRSILKSDGSELPDPRPVELPVGFERPESIQDMIRRLVRDPALREELEGKDVESFDDADDFDIPDDFPQSPHEENFDPLHLLAREQEIMSGTVRSRTPEELRAAADLIEKHTKKPAEAVVPAQPAKEAVVPAKPAEGA